MDSASVLPLCPSPGVPRPISALLLGSAGPEAVSAAERAVGGHTLGVSWGMLQAQLGRGTQLPAGEMGPCGCSRSYLTREKRWFGAQLTPCPFLLHRTPQGAGRAWVTQLESLHTSYSSLSQWSPASAGSLEKLVETSREDSGKLSAASGYAVVQGRGD